MDNISTEVRNNTEMTLVESLNSGEELSPYDFFTYVETVHNTPGILSEASLSNTDKSSNLLNFWGAVQKVSSEKDREELKEFSSWGTIFVFEEARNVDIGLARLIVDFVDGRLNGIDSSKLLPEELKTKRKDALKKTAILNWKREERLNEQLA